MARLIVRALSQNLGGRCLKRYCQRMEGGGNAVMTLFQRRVLLEMIDQKQSFQLSCFFYDVRSKVLGVFSSFVLLSIQSSQNFKKIV